MAVINELGMMNSQLSNPADNSNSRSSNGQVMPSLPLTQNFRNPVGMSTEFCLNSKQSSEGQVLQKMLLPPASCGRNSPAAPGEMCMSNTQILNHSNTSNAFFNNGPAVPNMPYASGSSCRNSMVLPSEIGGNPAQTANPCNAYNIYPGNGQAMPNMPLAPVASCIPTARTCEVGTNNGQFQNPCNASNPHFSNGKPLTNMALAPMSSFRNSMQMPNEICTNSCQVINPLNTSTSSLNNGQPIPSVPPLVAPQSGFVNACNPANMSVVPLGVCQMGLLPQNDSNSMSVTPLLMNQLNPSQFQGQIIAINIPSFPQQLGQNLCLISLQNPMQGVDQMLPMQIPNNQQGAAPQNQIPFANPVIGTVQQVQGNSPAFLQSLMATQQIHGNSSSLHQSLLSTQQIQGNPLAVHQSLLATQQVQGNPPAVHQSFMASQQVQGNPSALHQSFMASQQVQNNPSAVHQSFLATQQVQGNPSTVHQSFLATQQMQGNSLSVHQSRLAVQQVQGNSFALQQSHAMLPSNVTGSQGKIFQNASNSMSNSMVKSSPGDGLERDQKKEATQLRYQKPNSYHMDNGKRKLGFPNETSRKGHGFERTTRFGHGELNNEARRNGRSWPSCMEQKVKQWNEERGNSHQSKANAEKNQMPVNFKPIEGEAQPYCEKTRGTLPLQSALGAHARGASSSHLSSEKKEHAGAKHGPLIEKRSTHKRSIASLYTEQEIKQWREERKKNYPSQANMLKKQAEKSSTNPDALVKEAELRCQQMKDVLVKQTELGFQAAEVPSHYLSQKGRPSFRKRRRFHGRHSNRGRNRSNEEASKPTSPSVSATNKSKPTLLQKLLDADVRRDKRRLLQVLRFMSDNSFFQDWPEKPLRFPAVLAEDGSQICDVADESMFGSDDEDDDYGEEEAGADNCYDQVELENFIDKCKADNVEEGEIID